MSAEERVQRLERELTRAKRRDHWLLVGIVLAAMMGLLGWTGTGAALTAHAQSAGQAQKVISAQRFVLEDENGKTRAVLDMTPEGPVLAFFDENGKVRAALGQKAIHGQAFFLGDEVAKNRYRAFLGMTPEGAVLVLLDENGKPSASLNSETELGPMLELSDENGETRVVLGVNAADGPGLLLADDKEQWRVQLRVGKLDGPGLTVFDKKGVIRATLGAGVTTMPDGTTILYPESSLLLTGPDGKVIWQAPR